MPTHYAIPDQTGRFWPVCGDRDSPELTTIPSDATCAECVRRISHLDQRPPPVEGDWFGRKR